jgi:hypothetical protein
MFLQVIDCRLKLDQADLKLFHDSAADVELDKSCVRADHRTNLQTPHDVLKIKRPYEITRAHDAQSRSCKTCLFINKQATESYNPAGCMASAQQLES